MTTNPNTPLSGQTPPSGDPLGQTPTNNAQNPPGQTPPPSQSQTTPANGTQQTPITSLPPDIQDYIKRLRDEAEEANKLRKAEARAKAEAEAARLKEQGEFKALAEKHETRVKELEPLAERLVKLSELEHNRIDVMVKDWPENVKRLVPSRDVDAEVRLAQVENLQPLIQDLQVQARGTQPGNSPNPRPSQQTPENVRDEYEKRLRATAKYGA